jgi:regulator of protease activity HflC (stomatin/prohibitin superfamily)
MIVHVRTDIQAILSGAAAAAIGITYHLIRRRMRDDTMKPKIPVSNIGVASFVVCLVTGCVGTVTLDHPAPVIAGALIGLYLMFAIKVADQWEKVAVLRLGKYIGLRGPGIFPIIPIVDSLSRYVDQRVRVANVSAESTLTRDTVPVNVDAIVFWLVWNAEKSILEVADFGEAIMLSAQTALRESIGRHELAQMVTERELLGKELARILDEKTNPWGITVQSVEIRDVRIPAALEDAMSRQAQAERERQARIILGTAETEISEKFAQAAVTYRDNPVALHLRAMNMLYEAIKEKGSMVIVPSSAVETMGLGGTLATAALNGKVQ